MLIEDVFIDILDSTKSLLSNIKPSEWAEKYRVMGSNESQYEGPFRYNRTPYCREIVDCISPDHPARVISVMKGAQIGFSTGVIEPAIGYTIAENPGNILFLTGHTELAEEAVEKIDTMIDSCGIRHLIKPTALRKRASKTGDTNLKKQFAGGSLVAGGASNHKLLRQRSIRICFIDDFDAAKSSTKDSGSTRKMIQQRLAAYYSKMKLFYISTPELKASSNIEPVYLLGDQRKFHIPCPCCGSLINLEWSVPSKLNEKEMAGITWKVDPGNILVPGSVGYICQDCGGFFTDANKLDLLQSGKWIPTVVPVQPDNYSYHLSALYAPPGMFDWEYYVREYLECHPPGRNRNEQLYQTFVNLCLGQTFEPTGESPKANELQKNIRNYEIMSIPQKLAYKDGNGEIVLLTCASDLNGTEDDARLDYEIVAWTESGASYSICHGSIGTFIPRENSMKIKVDRERWSYDYSKPNNVWKEFNRIIGGDFFTDTDKPRRMKILYTGVDTGHYTNHAYTFIDKTPFNVIGLKGKNVDKFIRDGIDLRTFSAAKERAKLFLVEVNLLKDQLNECIHLKFDESNDDEQPAGFMNFPIPSGGKYLLNNYFEHFESEHRIPETSKDGKIIGSRWEKKTSAHQNHFWDVRIYNMVLKDIVTWEVCTELKIKNYTWKDYVDVVMGRYGK